MTIKNKIRPSNILMVIIPLAVTMASDQSLIYTYQEELWEINWGDKARQDQATGKIRQSDIMYYLEKKLTKMGYHFQVSKDRTILYSNISDQDMKIAIKTAEMRFLRQKV